VFECRPEEFFAGVNSDFNGINDEIYANQWKNCLGRLKLPDLKFTNFKVTEELCKYLPNNSLLHTTVLDSIRMSNYVRMNPTVRCFANIGADGIDGALSTFLGQAEYEDGLAFLLIGDLSLMYDMNALLRYMESNVRILVINNYTGAEFYKNFGIARIPTLDKFIAAGHHVKIKQCSSMANLKYMRANDLKSLKSALEIFVEKSDSPILLEVFTDAHIDAETLKKYWTINQQSPTMKETVKEKITTQVKKVLGNEKYDLIKQLIKKDK
jgi:2-succinyl-5-enolpyruvyl-6-hydroxy-3-cyclohexene-1-carboxylate synthase